jgi:hypothetical protein
MTKIRHFINGQDFGEPRNWRDLEIEIDWINQKESGAINVSDLTFAREANAMLQKRIMDGLDGGVGVFEGEPYTITIGDPDNPQFKFDGFLDFTEGLTGIGNQEIVTSLKKRKGNDWLEDVADSFSFAYLYDQGVITKADFVRVPYVINYVPDGMQMMILSMSIFMMTKELIENAEKLAESIAEVIDASTPVVGVGVGVGAVAVTSWDLGNFILVTLKAIARLAYVLAITVAIIKLIGDIFAEMLPKKRHHIGMSFRKLMERGCQHLGLKFESDIPELEWIHIPRKGKKGDKDDTGFPTNSEPIYIFGDLIRELKKMFNADHRIKNGVLSLKRRDKFLIPSGYQMPDFFNDQQMLLDRFKLNTDEMVANYNIYYQFDIQDQNTLDNQDGRIFQAITSPVVVKNPEFVNIKNLAEISIPFSLGLDKKGLNRIEKTAKVLGKIVDTLTGVFGGGTNFESQIESRVGAMLTSSHFSTTGKLVKMNGSRLASDQRKYFDARKLWDNYHFINSFAEYQGEHNQWIRFEQQPVTMSIEDFVTLMDNNFSTDSQGREYLIEKVNFRPHDNTAKIDFRVKRKYTTNLQIKLL